MTGMSSSFAIVAVATFLGLAFALVNFGLSRLIQVPNPTKAKMDTYECGEIPAHEAWKPVNIRYYTFALLFVVFDVEAIFLFPWAIVYKDMGWYVFVEMILFLVILIVGLIYAWRKGALRWS